MILLQLILTDYTKLNTIIKLKDLKLSLKQMIHWKLEILHSYYPLINNKV